MAAAALEQSMLESKDKDTLIEMAKALGVKVTARQKKADIIDKILDTTGSSTAGQLRVRRGTCPLGERRGQRLLDRHVDGCSSANGASSEAAPASRNRQRRSRLPRRHRRPPTTPSCSAPTANPSPTGRSNWPSAATRPTPTALLPTHRPPTPRPPTTGNDRHRDRPAATRSQGGDRTGRNNRQSHDGQAGAKQDGQGGNNRQGGQGNQGGQRQSGRQPSERSDQGNQGGNNRNRNDRNDGNEGGEGNRRRRRRRKGRGGQEGPQGEDIELIDQGESFESQEPKDVGGYLDIRDEGYGFLRVNDYLPSKEDAYIPLKLARQYGLRKGDHITGKVRPAGRNEKNPGLLEVYTINGADPELAKKRPHFESLTALFPDQRLTLEDPNDPANMTARIIDLVSPIGKGQRGIIVSPPKAGKTTVMKTIAKSIELNNPEVELLVLLIDERPEEVTDMRRSVKGEVISSTFDRPSDEHTHVAEMTIAKARRMVEDGKDVVIILDGITRLSRAYNLAAPASGKILSGGIDAGALYPPKKFFGSARNVEEGGSLTILATALVDTNSRMDEAIFEEFKGTGNMELRLDRKVAERRIYPAIDVDASSTRHEELLFDRKQLQQVWKLRRVLSGLAQDGSAAAGLELLIDRLKTFRTNDEFLAEIAKQPSM